MEKDRINYTAKFTAVKPINNELTLCRCRVMALGKNGNRSDITKEATDDAIPTLYNIPVIGHLYEGADGKRHMGAHDMEMVKLHDGRPAFKRITVPYGVVPMQDNVGYEQVTEEDGTEATYLVADVILWTGMYPEILETKYDDETYFNQSMEVKFIDTEKEDGGFTKVNKYSFSALCLLGKSDEAKYNRMPCFPSADVAPYQFGAEFERASDWDELVEEFAKKLQCSFGAESADKNLQQGGEVLEMKFENLLKEFGIEDASILPFELTDDMAEEEVRAKLDEFSASLQTEVNNTIAVVDEQTEPYEIETTVSEPVVIEITEEPEGEPAPVEPAAPEHKAGELTFREIKDLLDKAVIEQCVWTETEITDYWMLDFDCTYVYVEYTKGAIGNVDYGVARVPYTIKDNTATLDMASVTDVRHVYLTQEEIDKANQEKAEFEELKQYKADRIEADKKAEYSAIISEFSDLSGVEEYAKVVGEAMTFESGEALKDKLYAIRGKTGIFKKQPAKQVKFPIGNFELNDKNDDVDADTAFYREYLPKSKK